MERSLSSVPTQPILKPVAAPPRSLPCRLGLLAKRLFDVAASAAGLLLLSPFLLLLAWLVRRDTPGPALYRGPRLGKGGRPFHILKFRTMYECPQSYQGPPVTAQGDSRVTPLGGFLRDTKLNELPQLWNVLVGEMSLVGPRPEDPSIAAGWPAALRLELLSLRPGVTSPASVLYRNEETLLHARRAVASYLEDVLPSKLRLDQLYVRYRSFWLDLDILFWTLMLLLPRAGDYQPPEQSLFVGPLFRLVSRHLRWFVIDAAVSLVAMVASGLFWRSLRPLNVGWLNAFELALAIAFLFSLVAALLGVNRIAWSRACASDALDLVIPIALSTLVALFLNAFFARPSLPAQVILLAAALSLAGFVAVRYRGRLLRSLISRWLRLSGWARAVRERVLVVGGGEAGQFFSWYLESLRADRAFHVVGYVDDDLFKHGERIRGASILGRRADIPHLVHKLDVGVIVFAIHNIGPRERRELLAICASTPARLLVMPDILGVLDNLLAPPDETGSALQHSASSPSGVDLAAGLEDLETAALRGDLPQVLDRARRLRLGLGLSFDSRD